MRQEVLYNNGHARGTGADPRQVDRLKDSFPWVHCRLIIIDGFLGIAPCSGAAAATGVGRDDNRFANTSIAGRYNAKGDTDVGHNCDAPTTAGDTDGKNDDCDSSRKPARRIGPTSDNGGLVNLIPANSGDGHRRGGSVLAERD